MQASSAAQVNLLKHPQKTQMKPFVKMLTSDDPLGSAASQTQDPKLDSNIVHPVAYISGSFSQHQCK